MTDAKLDIDISANTSGEADTKKLADTVALVGDAVSQLASVAKNAASTLDKMERGIAGVSTKASTGSKEVKAFASAIRDAAGAQATLNKTAGDFKTPLGKSGNLQSPYGNTASIGNLSTKQSRDAAEATAAAQQTVIRLERQAAQALQEQLKLRRDNLEAAKALRLASAPVVQQTGTGVGSAAAVAGRFQASGLFAKQDAANIAAMNSKLKESIDNLGNYNDRLANTRYALYGLSTGLAVGGAALLALNVGIVKTAADFETAFANIERTSETSGDELSKLEKSFVQLGQTIPASFKDLGDIATLAGQLDIPAKSIANFTKIVAQFSATTNVSVEASATAFGRLDALLPDVKSNYEALGSSILNVGVNSVATESEIIQTTSQIAAAGAQAGLAASQIIGLAASYASLGVAPEASRGTTIRVFSEISAAVSQGTVELQTFAKLAGQTGAEFQKAWRADAGAAFIEVLKGLQTEGANAENTIRGLGITAVRDINALLKLSQNVELVSDNMGYAADGFDKATKLSSSFAIIAETLNSKVQELWNSFQALFATLGGTGVGILASLASGLKDVVVFFTELASNPVAQWFVTAVGSMTALSGVLLLVGSGFGKLIATLLSGRPVVELFNQVMDISRQKLALVKAEAAAAGVQMGTLRAGTIAAGAALKGLAASTGIGLGITVALTAVIALVDSVGESFKSAGDKAKDAFGDISGLSEALTKDTAAVKDGATEYGKVAGSITTVSEAANNWSGTLKDTTTGQITLAGSIREATTSTEAQTLSIGQNTAAWLANSLANKQNIQDLITETAKYNKQRDAAGNLISGGVDFNAEGVLTAAARNDAAAAQKIIDDYRAGLSSQNALAFDNMIGNRATESINEITNALSVAATQTEINKSLSDALGVSTNGTATAFDEFGTEAEDAAGKLSALSAAVKDAFSTQNAFSQVAADLRTLFQTIADGSDSFNAFDQAGSANLANLQSSIASTIAAGKVMGISATESVGILFQQLQQNGINTANLLASLANIKIPGVDMKGVGGFLNGTQGFSNAGQALAGSFGQIAKQGQSAAKATAGVGSAAADAAPKIVTLADYANDLAGVFKRSFDIRFGSNQALDTIASGWQAIADAADAAATKLKESQATLAQLAADKGVQEYFLSIANQYGDSLRAADITAKLADINNKIAAEQKSAAEAADAQSGSLEGNSKAAIANRATLLALVGNYQNYITALASSGASQATLDSESARLRSEFVAQAAQMGFNTTQVQVYAAAFDDMSLAINRVPRKVTIEADPNPALTAFREFEAKAVAAYNNVKNSVGQGVNIPITTSVDNSGNIASLLGSIATYQAQLDALRRTSTGDNNSTQTGRLEQAIYRLQQQLGSLRGYKGGGYTGNAGTSTGAGLVHGQEFVVDAPNTKRLGLPFLNALNNGAMPTSSQASQSAARSNNGGVQMVELVMSDKKLFEMVAEAVNISIDSRSITGAVRGTDFTDSQRGKF